MPPLRPICFLTYFLAAVPAASAATDPPVMVTPATVAAPDPLERLAGTTDTWKITTGEFEQTMRLLRPDWLNDGKTQARIGHVVRRETGKVHHLMGGMLPVYETVVNFEAGAVERVQLSLYNRGDAGDLSPDEFKRRIELAKTAITARAGHPGQDRGKATGAVLTKGWVWLTDHSQFLLESSMKRQQGEDRPEFIRLVIVPARPVPKAVLGTPAGTGRNAAIATLGSLKTNVIKAGSGDIHISNIPMVDQGQKGYCVVATAERVMRYFGADVDQHEMAQMADSSSGGGTSPLKMTEALDRIDSRFKLRLKRVMPWTERAYLETIKDYNRAARSSKVPEISADEAWNMALAYQKMDGETLKKARATPGAMDKFRKVVRSSIDMGVPLMWSVQLGLFKEGKLPQSGGGHMRLIIGYNDSTGEILFSDSWGSGHELKRMDSGEAWTITSGLYGMEPKAK